MDREALFKEFPILRTERCELREVTLNDADDLFRVRSQPEGAVYGPAPWEHRRQAEAVIRDWHKWFVEKEDVPWGVFLRDEDRLIGHFKYAYVRQYLGMIGYHLDVEYWNRGLMTELLCAVVGFLFDRTDVYRLQATVHKDNEASGRVLEKVGFRCEGLLRGRVHWQGRFCDLRMYAVLRGEQVVSEEIDDAR